MAKNRTMRVAVLMLALTLITSCFVGGTFAKYITEDNGNDSARVAKWGIELSVEGDEETFVKSYEGTDGKITVLSQTEDDLVAPGTKNANGVSFKIAGNPEVATKVKVSLGETEDVFLKFDADSDGIKESTYYPVEFTLTHKYGENAWSIAPAVDNTGADVKVDETNRIDTITGTLAEIEAVLKNLSGSMTQVNPGYTYEDEFTLTWEWVFEQPASSYDIDTYDTVLGDLAAEIEVDGYTTDDYNLNVAYDFAITVEQVD